MSAVNTIKILNFGFLLKKYPEIKHPTHPDPIKMHPKRIESD